MFTYALSHEHFIKRCFSHSISTKALNALLLDTIRLTATYAIQNRDAFIQKVRSVSQIQQEEAAKELKRKISKAQRRIAELDVLIKKLYETYAMGKLEEKRFELLSGEYEKEQAELNRILTSDQSDLSQFKEDTDRADRFLTLAKKYTDFSELTPAMLHEFVEKILVHAPDRSSSERTQEVEIYLKFIGQFEVPVAEPTPEEQAAEEKRRQKRIYAHKKYLERKERIASGASVPTHTVICECCGNDFPATRSDAKYCSHACRQKAYTKKRKEQQSEIQNVSESA